MKGIAVNIPKYEGPIELLYELVEKNKIDIYDIPIALLTDQYLAAISELGGYDMDSMSAFVLMGAHLLEIKSRMLLPKKQDEESEPEIDPRAELAAKLAEYRRFKLAADILRDMGDECGMEYYKNEETALREMALPETSDVINEVLGGISINALYRAFLDTLSRKELSADTIRGSFGEIKKDTYTIAEKMHWVKNILHERKVMAFSELFNSGTNKAEIIVTFLALLELIKQRIIDAKQNDETHEIQLVLPSI